MKGIINTTTVNFSSLIGNGKKYLVPKFQRDYSWDTEQWDDLWQDIESMVHNNEDHYMGYLVLQTSDNKEHLIIDGQQRFTTITFIILASIKAINDLIISGKEKEENEQRSKTLTGSYIGNIDPVSLEYDNYLVLNRNNDGYYKDYIVKLGELRRTKISASEKLMKRCFEWYENVLGNKFTTGKDYAEFIVKILDNLFFTVITVNDEMNAFRVFETLNARGVQLSSSDLLKNYLFSLVDNNSHHKSRIDILEEKWNKLTANMGIEKLPDFIRYYWNSKNKTVRANELFKIIRNNIKKDSEVFSLMEDLLSYSDIYTALKDKHDEYWDHDPEITEFIGLLNMFNLKQPYSLLMSADKNLNRNVFKKLLKAIIIVSFRYNIIGGKNPNDIEKIYNEAAVYISKNKDYSDSLIKKAYIEDREFKSLFSIKIFIPTPRNTKVIRYILGKLDNTGINIDVNDDNNSIEHILPQSPDDSWGIDSEKTDRLFTRLGNMCLLEKKINKSADNKDFSFKKIIYMNSAFESCRNICEYEQWNEDSIGKRQSQMADRAKSIWKLNF